MDARLIRAALVCAVVPFVTGASYRTQNFIVSAQSQQVAKQVGDAAEQYRRDLAIEWLGEPLRPWSQPCPVEVQVGERLGAGGATSFVFDHGEVFGWQMTIQGSLERVLDSVLPHEVTHTIFATHFRQPLPRWADEGACTTVEHSSERTKQQQMLIQFLKTGRGIPFSSMFVMKEYPADVLPLYAQGHSLAGYLIYQGGKKKFLDFVAAGLNNGENWTGTVAQYYGFKDLRTLQTSWLDWVRQGSPALEQPTTSVAAASQPRMISATTAAQAYAQPNLPTPPTDERTTQVAAMPAANSTVAAAGDKWVAANTDRRRERPSPNLIYRPTADQAAEPPAASIAADPSSASARAEQLVPVQFAGPADPFQAATNQPVATNAAIRTGVGRPQPPETPGQIVLEWSRTPEPSYSSAPMPQAIPTMLDAAIPASGIRR